MNIPFCTRATLQPYKPLLLTKESASIWSVRCKNSRMYASNTSSFHLLTKSTQPPYLRKLISVQPLLSTRSSFLVTLARPPTLSSLRITDRFFGILHLFCGIKSLCLSVNLMSVSVFLTQMFLCLSLVPLLFNHSPYLYLPYSFTTCITNLSHRR